MKFLILSTQMPSRYLVSAITERGHTYDNYDPEDLYLAVDPSTPTNGEIYLGSKYYDSPLRLDGRKYDAIITRLGSNLDYALNVLTHFTEVLGIYSPQSPTGLFRARNKWLTHQILAANRLSTMKTVFAFKPRHAKSLIDLASETMPIVLKKTTGSQGRQVIKCNDLEQTVDTLNAFWNDENELMLQRYINAQGRDIRAIVIGDKVVSAMERTAVNNWKANISLGGEGKAVTLSPSDAQLCIDACKAIGLEFGGVDLIKDDKGTSYIAEVNGNMGTKIIGFTDYNYFNDLIAYIERAARLNSLPVGHPDRLRAENQGRPAALGTLRTPELGSTFKTNLIK